MKRGPMSALVIVTLSVLALAGCLRSQMIRESDGHFVVGCNSPIDPRSRR